MPVLLVSIRNGHILCCWFQFAVDRGADGVRVMYWYHRQFFEAAQNRYCNDQTLNEKLHAELADFFTGKWASGKRYVSIMCI